MGLGIFLGDVHDAVCGPNARGCERPIMLTPLRLNLWPERARVRGVELAGMCPYGTASAPSRSRAMSICTGQTVTGRLRMRQAGSKPSHVDKTWLFRAAV